MYAYRDRLSPLAFHGDRLVHSMQDGLQRWDSRTMRRERAYPISYASFCFLQDGSLVASGVRDQRVGAVIHRIDPAGTLRSFGGPGGLDHSRLLTAAVPAELYGVSETEVVVLAHVGGRVVRVDAFPPPRATLSSHLRSFSLGDGRLVIPGDDLAVLHRDGSIRSYPSASAMRTSSTSRPMPPAPPRCCSSKSTPPPPASRPASATQWR